MPQLTNNFHSSEFFASDSNPHLVSKWDELPEDHQLNIFQLANRLQVIRDLTGAPIKITSGYRSEALNEAIGGSQNSYHLTGKAADIVIARMKPSQVQAFLRNWHGGLGKGATFTHVDIGPKRRWTY